MGTKKVTADRREEIVRRITQNPKFLRGIDELRENWGIPKDGFTSDEAIGKWHSNLFNESSAFFKSNKYKEARNRLWEKFGPEGVGSEDYVTAKNAIEANNPYTAFSDDIRKFALSLNLNPPMWERTIRRHLLSNKGIAPVGAVTEVRYTTEQDIEISDPINENSTDEEIERCVRLVANQDAEISIPIDAHTTLREVKRLWPLVERLQSVLKGHHKHIKPWIHMERDIKVLSLYEREMTHAEIAEELGNEYPDLDHGLIGRIISTTRKHFGL